MNADIGKITARLAERDEAISTELIKLINTNINPPEPLEKDDVYIRAMYVVSDEVNSFGGCFPTDEHQALCRLLIDSPVMVGHRKDRLPIGRNFHAAVVEHQGRHWVKSYFYWLKSAQGADTLRENIDGGIYKECSIGFTFLMPECSVCGQDIRTCEHQPFERYDRDGTEVVCHFNYRQIERVLETSLVYRGAVADTSISKELRTQKAKPKVDLPATEQVITSPTELDAAGQYLVTPRYEGLPVLVTCSAEGIAIVSPDGVALPEEMVGRFTDRRLPEMRDVFGYLIGLRGKERCRVDQVRRFIDGKSSSVRRLEIRLFPRDDFQLPDASVSERRYQVRMQPGRLTDLAGLSPAALALSTRDGVKVWPEGKYPPRFAGYSYHVDRLKEIRRESPRTVGYYTLKVDIETGRAQLMLTENDAVRRLEVRQFDFSRLAQGARFVTDAISEPDGVSEINTTTAVCGDIVESTLVGKSTLWRLTGHLNGQFCLQPIKLHERQRYIFHKSADRLKVTQLN
ncbi:MAG: hypothetical protein KOO62_08500 [candidate division Zixibacteria bacterium]|nr:hypothetical protein [candidate division Zixibacteria bacterium]